MYLVVWALYMTVWVVVLATGCVIAVFGAILAIFLGLATPLVQLCGREPWSGPAEFNWGWLVGLAWLLALAPLHWANYQLLGWGGGTYLLLTFGTGVVLAFVVLVVRSSPREWATQ